MHERLVAAVRRGELAHGRRRQSYKSRFSKKSNLVRVWRVSRPNHSQCPPSIRAIKLAFKRATCLFFLELPGVVVPEFVKESTGRS